MDRWIEILVAVGGVANLGLMAIFAYVVLLVRNSVLTTKVEVLSQVRGEYVPADVCTVQHSNTNLLLRNIGTSIEGLQGEVHDLGDKVHKQDTRLAKIEQHLSNGTHFSS